MDEQIPDAAEMELPELEESLQRQRELALDVLLKGVAWLGGAVMLIMLYTAAISGAWRRYLPFVTLYAVVLFVVVVKGLGHRLRAGILILLTYAVGVYVIQMNGLDSSGSWFLLLSPFMAFVLLGERAGKWTAAISVAIYLFFAAAHYYRWPGWMSVELPYDPTSQRQVLNMTASFFLVLAVVWAIQRRTVREQTQNLKRIRQHLVALGEARRSLEERAIELARANQQAQKRAWQLQAAAGVLRATRGIATLDVLLQEAVRSLHTQFRDYGVDRVAIYMLSPEAARARGQEGASLSAVEEESLAVRAAVGTVPPGVPDVVKTVLRSGVPGLTKQNFPPAVELALPLRGRVGTVREAWFEGVIYIHTPQTLTFQEEDLSTLQTLADQLSIVIQNVILLQRTQEQLREMRTLYQQYSREIWRSISQARAVFRYDQAAGDVEVAPLTEEGLVTPAQTALEAGEPVVEEGESGKVTLALPIRVRDTVIGVVHAEGEAAGGLSRAQISLAETLVSQLALALDSARLFQDAQRRAARERLTGEITARVRETLDVDTVLKTAAAEVRRALGLPEVVIRLASRPPDGD